ncbi:LLM class flavin-dependent oxidoreductase [Halostagnicola bangensis]
MVETESNSLQFGCQLVSYDDVHGTIQDAVRAEAAGFDIITVPDHLFHPTGSEHYLVDPPWEAFTVLGAIAQHTDDATLLPAVTDSVRRHPTELAHATATLDRLTNGRAGFGIGAGEAFNFEPIEDIDWTDPFTRFTETLEIVDGLWNSRADEPFSFDGEFFTLEDAHMGFEPVQEPRPPIWVGGYGPSMRGVTGALADGWIPWIHAPDQYEADLERILTVMDDRGRDPNAIDRAVMIPTTVSEDHEAARRLAIERNRTSLALRPQLLTKMGHEAIANDTPVMFDMSFDREQKRKLDAAARRIPDEAVDRVTASGDPERVIDQLESFVDAGVDHVVLIPVGDFDETVSHYEETIIPHFKTA